MAPNLAPRPLLTWDAFALRVDLDMLELWLNREVAGKVEEIRRFEVRGEGETVELAAEAAWKGIPARLLAELSDLRLYRRFFGCRVVAARGPLGLPLPLELVARLVGKVPGGLVRLDPDDRILLVDLQRWLPPWLDLHVEGVRCEGRWLVLGMAPGLLQARFAEAPLPTV